MAGFLRKFAEDSRETLKASFSLTTSREVAKKTPSGPQEVEFILATNYAVLPILLSPLSTLLTPFSPSLSQELPKKYQQLLSKSKITQIQADNYWFATRQALRFTAKTHIIHYTVYFTHLLLSPFSLPTCLSFLFSYSLPLPVPSYLVSSSPSLPVCPPFFLPTSHPPSIHLVLASSSFRPSYLAFLHITFPYSPFLPSSPPPLLPLSLLSHLSLCLFLLLH